MALNDFCVSMCPKTLTSIHSFIYATFKILFNSVRMYIFGNMYNDLRKVMGAVPCRPPLVVKVVGHLFHTFTWKGHAGYYISSALSLTIDTVDTCKGHTLWCAIGVGASQGTLSWWAPCSPYKRRGICGSVYGYPASKISLGPLWI